jgi:hypothetical protein
MAVAAVGVVVSPVVASAASAAPTATGCQPGYSVPGPATFAETLASPRIVTGLAQGAYTEAELAALFVVIDANGNGSICLKDVSNLRGNSAANHGAFYQAADDGHPIH